MTLALDLVRKGGVALIGVPLDENSSYLRGCALGPARVREVIASGSSNMCAESGTDVGTEPRFVDAGDIEIGTGAAAMTAIESGVASLLERDTRVLSMGGDHSVTYPIVRAHAHRYPQLSLLHFDAHPDLYDDFGGNRFSHASPFARIMEEGLVQRLVQVGIRTLNPHQRAQAERFGVEMIQMADWRPDTHFDFTGPVYLTFDLDALDPRSRPGCRTTSQAASPYATCSAHGLDPACRWSGPTWSSSTPRAIPWASRPRSRPS